MRQAYAARCARSVTESRAKMKPTDARVEVLAAAVRAFAQVLTPEQSCTAAGLFLRHVEPLGRQALRSSTNQAASAAIALAGHFVGGTRSRVLPITVPAPAARADLCAASPSRSVTRRALQP